MNSTRKYMISAVNLDIAAIKRPCISGLSVNSRAPTIPYTQYTCNIQPTSYEQNMLFTSPTSLKNQTTVLQDEGHRKEISQQPKV